MNPSRLFILRPVATTLLMVAIMLVGHRRLSLPAALGAAGGRLSDDPGADLLSGRQPGCDDLVGHRAAGAAVRPDAGPEPDVVDELGRRLGHHAAVQPRPQPRRRRAGGAGGDQRGRQPAAVRPAGAADLRQGQSGRRADPDAGAHLEDAAADRRCRTSPTRASRRRSRSCRASASSASAAASGRRCASRPIRARSPPTASTSTICAPPSRNANVNTPKGNFDGPTRAYTINANDQLQTPTRLQRPRHRLPERRAGPAVGRRDVVEGAENTKLGAWMNEHAGGHPQRPAPARRQRHRGRRPHQGAAAAAAGGAAGGDRRARR